MKANRLVVTLLLLSAAVFQLPAQQSEADRKLLAEIRVKAEKGDAQSQDELGTAFHYGDLGVVKDEEEAVKWFRKAAGQGHAQAQFDLGQCYYAGTGVKRNLTEATKWFRQAADQGYAGAQYNLGVCYDNGTGVRASKGEAFKWYLRAAEQGFTPAQENVGICYASGEGVKQNHSEAAKWFRLVAQKGEADGEYNLGLCYEKGQGVEKDLAAARDWYRRAAQKGYGEAQYNLGLLYAQGNGVPRDYVEAYAWLNMAAAQGEQTAKKLLAALERGMTASQVAEAQRLSRSINVHKNESGSDTFFSPGRVSGPRASGTGFFISDDGYLISNNHVVKDATQIRLVTTAGLISAKVVKVDAANDLALLKAEGRFAPLPITPSRSAKLGSTAATVGFPNFGLQGFAPKLSKGEIASLSGVQDDSRYFQISVPVQPGNSGGALVDEHGNVVGVVSAKLNARAALQSSGALPENVNYAVKSSYLLSFLESFPEVANKLKAPESKERKFEDVVKSAEQAAVLVLVY